MSASLMSAIPQEPPRPQTGLSPTRLLERWQWPIVIALSLLALWIRVAPRFHLVFQPGFVDFQDNDAWYHVRVAENLVRHFPFRIAVDPYLTFGRVQETATAPTYDWVLGLISWLVGLGAPSDHLVDMIAAWYPAVLGALTVLVSFLLAKLVFGVRAALLAAATVATLPGHFLYVSSLGVTDHHIMESLLATLFFLLILRAIQQPDSFWLALFAGITLSAYLLTFPGSAMLAGVVVAWAVFYRARSLWKDGKRSPLPKPLYGAFSIALCVCLLFHRLLWMNLTIAALALGIMGLAALDVWGTWGRPLRLARLPTAAGLALVTVAISVTVLRIPSLRHPAKLAAMRLLPGLLGASGGVTELRSLIVDGYGHYSLIPPLQQFGLAYLIALLGLLLLIQFAFKRVDAGKLLILIWGLATFILSIGQLRMTYYYAVVVALLTGYVADRLIATGRKTALVTVAFLILGVFAPTLYADFSDQATNGIPVDWRETLDWMRASTPEPFGDPNFYYARYDPQVFGLNYRYPQEAYSIMAWWDYGYWIMNVARRIPVANPTQTNADAAADFFLAQSEPEAAAILENWRTRYVVVDERLPLWPTAQEGMLVGDYRLFFDYSRKHQPKEYYSAAYQLNNQGQLRPKVFYLPAYYRSVVVRLFTFGGRAVDGRGGATLITLRQKTLPHWGPYQEIVESRHFESAEFAQVIEAQCKKDGCVLVGEDPTVSCVPLDALESFRPVFSSTTSSIGLRNTRRKRVQVYEFTGGRR
jgi:dolichyl-diphosphooligosaccharide--protein glycosyltransferase